MKNTFIFGGLLIMLLFCFSCSQTYQTQQPIWLTSNYFRAGNQCPINGIANGTVTGNSTTPTYTFTYSSALPGIPGLAYGIKNYRGNDTMMQQFFEISKVMLSNTNFEVQIQIFGITNLWMLCVAYLAVDPTFPHHLNTFYNVPLNYTSGDLVNITSASLSPTTFTQYINYTDQATGMPFKTFLQPYSNIKVVLYITSLWIRASSSYPLSLTMNYNILNSSYYQLTLTLLKSVIITNIHFSMVIYDQNDIQSSKAYYLVYDLITWDTNGGFTPLPIEFMDNFIMGLSQYNATLGSCGFEYQYEFQNGTYNGNLTFGVEVLPSIPRSMSSGKCGFSVIISTVIYMQTWKCTAPYLYFNISSSLCQNNCAAYYFGDNSTWSCEPCVNSVCYVCSSGNSTVCLSCDITLHLELMNSTCVCQSGYFMLNNTCQACSTENAGCLVCTYPINNSSFNISNFQCSTCNTSVNYLLNTTSNLCVLCTSLLSHCISCSSFTACTTCDPASNTSLNSAGLCVTCQVIGCLTCGSSPTICTICDTASHFQLNNGTCVCQSGYYFLNNSCKACSVGNPGCLLCSYPVSNSSSFNISNFQCSTCNTSVNYLLNNTSNLCVLCTSLLSYCISCSSFTSCDVCDPSSNTTLNSLGLCLNCQVVGCLTCGATSSICSICDASQGYSLFGTTCSQCANNCTCPGYALPKLPDGSCSAICGDGIIISPNQQCDDANLNDGDGCSSTCQVEQYYYCHLQPSSCYLTGSINISLIYTAISTVQCNSISFTFKIQPDLPIFKNPSLNWSGFITADPSSPLIFENFQYDPTNQQMTMSYKFTQTIQNSSINFQVNSSNLLAGSLLFSQISVSQSNFTVHPNNNLVASLCQKDICTGKKQISILSIAELSISYVVLALSIFSAKIIGLQLFGVLQLSYFVLSDYHYVNPILSSFLGRNEVNGFNSDMNLYSNISTVSQNIAANGFSSEVFLNNFNVMFLLTFLCFLVGLVTYIITYIINKDAEEQEQNAPQQEVKLDDGRKSDEKPQPQTRSQWLHRMSKYILKEALVTFLIFNMFNLSFSVGLQIKYLSDVYPLAIICLLISIVLVVLMVVAMNCADKLEFGQFFDKFKENSAESKYIVISMIYRFVLGLCLAVLNQWDDAGIVFLFIVSCFLAYILYFQPFKDKWMNYRSLFMHSTHFVVVFVFLYYQIESADDLVQSSYLHTPAYMQITMVFLCIVVSTLMLGRQFYIKYIKSKGEVKNVNQSDNQIHQFVSQNGHILQSRSNDK